MARLKFWQRLSEGLRRTANIVSITILTGASILTLDWLLLLAGGAIEVAYLTGYVFWPLLPKSIRPKISSLVPPDESSSQSSHRAVMRWLASHLLTPPSRLCVDFLDGVLIVVTVIGFVVIFFFGFGKHLLSHPWPYMTHAEGWDVGALIWTAFFLLYFMLKFPFTNVRLVDKAIFVLSLGGVPLLYLASVYMHSPATHVFFVWLIGLCLFLIDLLIWKRHPKQQEKDFSRASLLWAHIPIVAALLVLLVYLWGHPDTEHTDVFVSGVVSCQLLISNAVFIVLEFGLLQPSKVPSPKGKTSKGLKSKPLPPASLEEDQPSLASVGRAVRAPNQDTNQE